MSRWLEHQVQAWELRFAVAHCGGQSNVSWSLRYRVGNMKMSFGNDNRMKSVRLCVVRIALCALCSSHPCSAQERPKAAGSSNRVVAALTWPFRAYYAETKATFRDLRNDRLLRAEAVSLFGTAAFENVTLERLYSQNPTSRVNYPARLFVGHRPHGLQLWLVTGAANIALFDTAHSLSRDRNYPRRTDPFMKYTTFAGIVGLSSWYTIAGVHNLNLKNPPVSKQSAASAFVLH
jgi:hypothetical protein